MNQKLLLISIKWSLRFFFDHSNRTMAYRDAQKWIRLIQKWISTKGILWTIKRVKLIRLISTKYLCGEPIYVYPELIGINKDGFPKAIEFLRKYADGTKFQKQFFLTLMSVSRTFTFEAKPDYSSITDPFKGRYETIDQNFVTKFVEDFDLRVERVHITGKDFMLTMKQGPLGHSLMTAIQHYMKYNGSHLQHFMKVGGPWVTSHIHQLKLFYRNKLVKDVSSIPAVHRRLAIIHDPEAKARIVGLVDYLTQVILEPFSREIFKLLKSLPQDRTFTQNPYLNKVPGHKFHSLDLSSATDRFPIGVQRQLVSELTDPNFAYSWSRLMTGTPFTTPEGNQLTYSVGQPMGARSSWAVFTLSHHMMVQYAAHKAGYYPFKDYILLGDDIVIANDTVAQEYRILMEGLGVDISSFKTHTSENMYEFAKRWFHNSQEITGVPLNGIMSNIDKPFELYNSIKELYNRGYSAFYLEGSISMTLNLISMVKPLYQKQYKYYYHLLENFRIGMINLSGDLDYQTTRYIWGMATKHHEDFPLPNESTMREEYSRVGSSVINTIILDILKKIERFGQEMIQNGPLLIGVSEEVFQEIKKDKILHVTPNWRALENSLVKLGNSQARLGATNDLMSIMSDISLVNIEALSKMDRSSIRLLYQAQKFSTKLYKQLEFEPNALVTKVQSMRAQRAFMDVRKSLGLPLRGDLD